MSAARRVLQAVALIVPLFVASASAQPFAELLLLDANIVTLDDARPRASAIAIRGDTIVAAGGEAAVRAAISPTAKEIRLGGRTIIPGLIDSHIHAIRAGLTYATEVDWTGAKTVPEALGRLRERAEQTPPESWLIVAGGFVERQFAERRRPTRAEIESAAPGRKVYIQLLYSAVLLSAAAESDLRPADAGLTADGDEAGWWTGDTRAITALYDKLPRPEEAARREGTRAFFARLNALGVTGVLDPGGYNIAFSDYDTLFALARDDALTMRVDYTLSAPRPRQAPEDLSARIGTMQQGEAIGLTRFIGVGENAAWGMYNNNASTAGDKAELRAVLRLAAARKLGATFHWHFDRTVHHLLDVLDEVNRETPIGALRWSIAHLNDASPETLARMKALGLGWLTQNALYFRGEAFLGERGFEAVRTMPPIASALRLGIPVGAGTDATRVMSYNPFTALQWMVDGVTAGGVATRDPAEALTREQALRLFTLGSAWFAHDDQRRGSFAPGKLADLAVLDRDYLTVPTDEIGTLRAVLTMVGGRIVHDDIRAAETTAGR